MLLQVLQPLFDPTFSEHSYGFRPKRERTKRYGPRNDTCRQSKDWVVDMDITKFFDHVHHDILMNRIGRAYGTKGCCG
jgi:retron-type reverse transcriptase